MTQYRGYTIEYRQKPVPTDAFDWQFVAADYDGPPDPRCGCAASEQACREMIDELEDDCVCVGEN